MKDEYKKSLAKVLVYEGGKVDDPHDPGGRTNKGVTQKVFNTYLSSIGKKPRDVYTMTDAECEAIYRKRYWNEIEGDNLPPGVAFTVFDGAVNSGVMQSGKWLQRALGDRYTGKVDGVIGMGTLQAVKTHPDHDKLVAAICERRMSFLQSLKTWKRYGKGWSVRVANVKATGQAWAMGSVGPEVVWTADPEAQPSYAAAIASQAAAKANLEDAKPSPVKAIGDVVGTVGATTTVAAQGLQQGLADAKEQLSSFAGVAYVEKVLLILTVAGLALAAGGFAYRYLMAMKSKDRADALDLAPAGRA